jgi:glycerol kinase
VQGGFANNAIYLTILSALLPDRRILRSGFSETTSLGAALCAKCAEEDLEPKDVEVNMPVEEVPKPDIDYDKLSQYLEEFLSIVSPANSNQ